MAISALLFDKDGTIIDYWLTWVPINREVALFAAGGDNELAVELLRAGGYDPATMRILPGSVLAAGSVDDIAGAFAAHLGSRTPDQLAAGIEAIFRQAGAQHARLVDGAGQTIAELKRRGYRLGLATNDLMGGLNASLAQHDILGLFDFKVGCDSGFGSKPDPRMVFAFCAAVGVLPSAVAMVGDAPQDLRMGRSAGVGLTVGVLGGTSAREDLEPYADLIIESINDLLLLADFSSR